MYKELIFLIGICFIVTTGIVYAEENNSDTTFEDSLYQKVDEMLNTYSGDPVILLGAYRFLEKIVEKNPDYPLAYVGFGRAEYNAGHIHGSTYSTERLQAAYEYFNHALELDPTLFEAYLHKGYAYLYGKYYQKADEMVRQAEKIHGVQPETLLLSAKIARQQKDNARVIEKAEAVTKNTDDKRLLKEAYTLLAPLYRKHDQIEKAEKVYQKLIALDPDSAWAKIDYSSFLTEKKEYDNAIAFAQKALDLENIEMGHLVLSNAFYKKGAALFWNEKKPKEAIPYFMQALEENKENVHAYYGLGGCYTFMAGYENDTQVSLDLLTQAENAYKKVFKFHPTQKLKALTQKEIKHVAELKQKVPTY